MDLSESKFRSGHGLTMKISLMVTFILAFGVGISLFLNYMNFLKSYRKLVGSRFEVVSSDLKNTIESGLNLGLGLGEMMNIPPLLESARKTQKDILFIKVFAPDGTISFSSDAQEVGKSVPAGWQEMSIRGKEKTWQFAEGELIVQGVDLINSYQQHVGTVALGYPGALVNEAISDVRQFLLLIFFSVLLVFYFLVILVTRMMTRGLLGSLHRIVDSLVSGQSFHQVTSPKEGCHGELEEAYAAFQLTHEQVQGRLHNLHNQVDTHLTRNEPEPS